MRAIQETEDCAMADERLLTAGVITAIVGGVLLMIGATVMIYPEETVQRGGLEVVQPYFTEGSVVFAVGIVVLFAGVGLYAAGRYRNPAMSPHSPVSRHR